MIGKTTIATHNGGFHADDVFAVATILLFLEKDIKDVEIIRSRDPEDWESADFVLDVGGEYDTEGKRFDHHQRGGAGKRGNGIPYASFGLVWEEYGEEVCGSQEIALEVDSRLAQPIDAGDNGISICKPFFEGVYPYTISDVVASFVDFEASDNKLLEDFKKAVVFAQEILVSEIKKISRDENIKKKLKAAYESTKDKKIIVLEGAQNWSRSLIQNFYGQFSEPVYAVRKHKSTGWQVVAVEEGIFTPRRPFPKEWAGKRDIELQKETGVDDSLFCHNARFMCIAESKEGAVKLARKALNIE